jgi:hypothetical protein
MAVAFPIVWIVCAAAATVVLDVLDHSNQVLYARLVRHGAPTAATVTRTQPHNHSTVFYSFVVAGRTYSSADVSRAPNPEAANLRRGNRIRIVYDTRNPNVSCACDPHALRVGNQWWRRAIGALWVSSVIAVVITLNLRRRWESRDRRRQRAFRPAG